MPEPPEQAAEIDQEGTGTLGRPEGYRRNFWCLALDFGFFGIGMAFFGPSTVIPGFLTTLGASATVIGLLATLQRAGWLLPQLLAARYLADKPYKKPYIIVPAAISRSVILMLSVLVLITRAQPPGLTIAATTFALAIFWISDGLGSMAWFDFLSKSVPPNRRGRLTSIGQVLSGVLSFAAGFAVEWILSANGPAYPTNYASLFLFGFGMLTLSLTMITLGVETRSRTAARVPSWREYLPQLGRILKRDHAFRRYLLTRQVFGLAGLAGPFYITYALDQLQLPDQVAGRFTSVGVIGGIIAAALFGWLNERYGTRIASQASIPITAAIPILALMIPRWITDPLWLAWGYSLVFLMNQASMSCYLPAWTAYVLEWASETERPLYVGLTNTLNGFTALFATLGGLILQWTDNNYQVLFIITAIGTLIALPLSFSLPEPRKPGRASVLT
ncbi:MAG: MFS transporter [Anaerolineae bacterium]|nr:MFS transporter [Anaerolineae bacterium]